MTHICSFHNWLYSTVCANYSVHQAIDINIFLFKKKMKTKDSTCHNISRPQKNTSDHRGLIILTQNKHCTFSHSHKVKKTQFNRSTAKQRSVNLDFGWSWTWSRASILSFSLLLHFGGSLSFYLLLISDDWCLCLCPRLFLYNGLMSWLAGR